MRAKSPRFGSAAAPALASAALLAACAGTPAALRPEAARPADLAGYLDEATLVRLADAVPPPPAPGSAEDQDDNCLLYTSPSPRDQRGSRMPSSA